VQLEQDQARLKGYGVGKPKERVETTQKPLVLQEIEDMTPRSLTSLGVGWRPRKSERVGWTGCDVSAELSVHLMRTRETAWLSGVRAGDLIRCQAQGVPALREWSSPRSVNPRSTAADSL